MVRVLDVEKIKRMLLVTIAVMFIAMGYYVHEHIKNENGKVKPIKTTVNTDAEILVNDVEIVETLEGRMLWKLRANTAEIYTNQKKTRMKNVEVDFFDEFGEQSMHLISNNGVKDDQTGDIALFGNVKATDYQHGVILRTEVLFYKAEPNLITSDRHVVIQRGNMVTEGDGLESSLDLSQAKILNNVNTYFVSEEATSSASDDKGAGINLQGD